ncbi:MAG: TRM11 family SAM-dependent methyltransferase [Thermoproteus sp.]
MVVLDCPDCAVAKRAAFARPLEASRDKPVQIQKRSTVTMDAFTARLLANLAMSRRLSKVLEPFIGSGAVAAEAERYGAYVVGIDIDADMLRRAAANTSADLVQADSRMLPLRKAFDAAVGDAPYGRMSVVEGDVEGLIRQFLDEAMSVVRGRIVLAIPIYFDVPQLRSCAMYVHGGLYRVIIIAQSGGGPS